MNEIQPFDFDGTDVRVVTDEQGEPWFVASDVCAVLGIANPRDAVARLDDDEKGVASTDTLGGRQQVTTVSEPGLYSLVARSRKPEARAFDRWVRHEVLPAIRRAGQYSTAPALTEDQIVHEALQITARKVAELTPKAEAFDAFLSTSGDYSVNEAAKILSRHHDILTGERRLRTWMEGNGWIYRDGGKPRAYQSRLDQGRLAEKAQWHYHPETGEKVADAPQVRVTAKGVEALAKALTKVADQGELDVGGRVA